MVTETVAVSSRFAYTGDDDDGEGPSTSVLAIEESDDAPSSSTPVVEPEDESKPRDMFITHQVDKMDTLAGLAIKYNISVSDIKLVNGLLSDSAMFARDTLLIPTETLPIGLEYSAWAAMIITRHGRVANGGAPRMPKNLLGIQDPDGKNEAIEQLRRHYQMDSSSNLAAKGEDGVHCNGTAGLRHTNSSLELSNLSSEFAGHGNQHMTIVLKDNAGSADDRVRRRRGAGDSSSWLDEQEPMSSTSLSPSLPNGGGRSASVGRGSTHASSSSANLGWPRESLMQKLKKVASNPTLSASAQHMATAAEGMISSFSENVKPGFKSLKNMLVNKQGPAQVRGNPKRD